MMSDKYADPGYWHGFYIGLLLGFALGVVIALPSSKDKNEENKTAPKV